MRQAKTKHYLSSSPYETQRKPHCLHQSRSIQPATYVCTVPVPNFHEQPTVEADRTMKICLPTSIFLSSLRCDGSLRLKMVRCDSVLIQDCELSQRKSISLRFFMPLNLRILLKTRRRKLGRRISKSGRD